MAESRSPRISRQYVALIGALTALAHAGINELHKREMRSEVRESVRGFTSPELATLRVQMAHMAVDREKSFVRKTDLVPITQELRDVHQEVNEQGQRLGRMEGYLKAMRDLQRKEQRLRAALPGAHLEANGWEPERPSRNF